jgi:hypothetical protein
MRLIFLAALLVSLGLRAEITLPPTYSAGPTYGTVVDDETGQPVPGVMVVAQWVLEGGMHWDRIGVFEAHEAVSDAEGKFRIEGWGPRTRPLSGVLVNADPQLVTIRPGYRDWTGTNTSAGVNDRVGLAVRDSRWNGTTIRIQRLDSPSSTEPNKTGYVAGTFLGRMLQGDDCSFRSLPRAIRVLDEDAKRSVPLGPRPIAKGRGEYLMERHICGDLSEFSRVYSSFIQDSAGPTFGTVVDEQGSPVSGAVVVVRWQVGVIMLAVRESVTDDHGRFAMPGWGPLTRPVQGSFECDPQFIVFQAGYTQSIFCGGNGRARMDIPNQSHDWLHNGATIKLSRFSPDSEPDLARERLDPDRYLPVRRLFNLYLGSFDALARTTDCRWVSTPKMVRAIDDELSRLSPKSAAMKAGPILMAKKECGALDDFRRGYEAGVRP